MPSSVGSSDDHFDGYNHSSSGQESSSELSRLDSPSDSISDAPIHSQEFLGYPELSLNGTIQLKRYEVPAQLPRPKEFYKKELEEIAELLEKKFKQSNPYELEYVNSMEAQGLFLAGLQLFQEILQYSVTINSDTFRAWVLIQRWSGRMQRPEVLYNQIKQLGIHRPSFRLCASILTSYANGSYQLAKREYVECAIESLVKMKEHNYVPNTYVYNALFVMCNKNQLYREVWKFYIDLMLNSDPTHIILDGFTCASLMETCVAEQNPHKGISIYDIFKQLPNSLKKNNEKYISQLKSKLDDIYEEQAQDYNFAELHESWKDIYSNGNSGTSSQQSPEKLEHVQKHSQNHETGPQNHSANSQKVFQPTYLDNISSPPILSQTSNSKPFGNDVLQFQFDDSRAFPLSSPFDSFSHSTWKL